MNDQQPAPSLFTAKIEQFKAQLSETALHALQLSIIIGSVALLALIVVTCWVNDRPKLGHMSVGAGAASAIPGDHPDHDIIHGVRGALPWGKNTHGENFYPLGHPSETTVINGAVVGPGGAHPVGQNVYPAQAPAYPAAAPSAYPVYQPHATPMTHPVAPVAGTYVPQTPSWYHVPISDRDGTRLKTITSK